MIYDPRYRESANGGRGDPVYARSPRVGGELVSPRVIHRQGQALPLRDSHEIATTTCGGFAITSTGFFNKPFR